MNNRIVEDNKFLIFLNFYLLLYNYLYFSFNPITPIGILGNFWMLLRKLILGHFWMLLWMLILGNFWMLLWMLLGDSWRLAVREHVGAIVGFSQHHKGGNFWMLLWKLLGDSWRLAIREHVGAIVGFSQHHKSVRLDFSSDLRIASCFLVKSWEGKWLPKQEQLKYW